MKHLKTGFQQKIRKKSRHHCKNAMILVIFLMFVQMAFAQQTTITGKVTDETGDILVGATVAVKGTLKGVVTDLNGEYAIQASPGAALLFSHVGYLTEEVLITAETAVIDINLKPDIKSLEEIVVVGYGVQRKEDLTSSVASVKADDFTKGSIKSVGQLIQGKVAGLAISNVSGDPNGEVEIMLRGAISINGSTSPLIVIDGVPGGSLSMVAPEDIESIDILKDGSAAAIYGTRANSGVVLITTKKADKKTGGDVKVNINSYYNYDMVNKRIEVLNADEFRSLIAEVGPTVLKDKNLDLETIDKGYDTDWIGELMDNRLNYTQHISVQGGSENSTVMGSVTYKKLDGIWLKTSRNSLTSRLNYTQALLDNKVNFDFNVLNRRSEYENFNQESFRQAVYRNPTDRVFDDEGNYVEDPSILFYFNPVSMINERVDEGKDNESMLSGKVTVEPVANLKISAQGSLQLYNSLSGYASTNKHMDYWSGGMNRASRSTYHNDTRNVDLTANYRKMLAKHSVDVLAGYCVLSKHL